VSFEFCQEVDEVDGLEEGFRVDRDAHLLSSP
jgi:hypothetical protein